MKAIKTTYFGPSNVKGSRIKASDDDHNSVTLPWDHALDGQGNSRAAALALLTKMKWAGTWHCGALKNHYVWVCVNKFTAHDENNTLVFWNNANEPQPKTGENCNCKPGNARDNCPACEGTGHKIDFRAIRARNR